MLRESLAANARHAFVLATPTNAKPVSFQRRVTTGGASVSTAGPFSGPGIWLRLVRTGNVVSAYWRPPSPSEPWTLIGSQTFASLPATMLLGFAVSSHERGRLAEARFFEWILSRPGGATWRSDDVGSPAVTGSSSIDEDSGPEYTVHGSGADVWGTADAFHYLSREVSGDFDFSARAAHVEDVDRWTKAGLMMRDGLAANARHAFVIQTPRADRGVAFQRRQDAGGQSVHSPGPANAPPGFLRLVRNGDVVSAFYKPGTVGAWQLIGTQTFPGLPATVRIGFAVSSHVDGELATAMFDNVRLTP
jgi:hypothetical protein